jgi:hypothetical protein
MPRVYTIEFEGQSVTNANGDYDLFSLQPADDKPIEITGLVLVTTSEIAEAQEEFLRIRVVRGHTSLTGGTSTTPVPADPIDTASGATCAVLHTTIASAGTAVFPFSDAFQVRAGYNFMWPDRHGPRCSQAQTSIVVRLMAAVTDDVTMSGTLFFQES